MSLPDACEVCAIPLDYAARERCPSPSCPCYSTTVGSDEMHARALAWRSRPSVAAARAMTGHAALRILAKQTGGDPQAARDSLLLSLRYLPKPDDPDDA
jgi:hypothetical protein